MVGGLGGDLILRLSRDAQPYLLGNLGAGLFNFRRSVTVNGWSLWSVGAGYEIF